MTIRPRGFTLIEMLAALAVAAVLAVGLAQLVLSAMDDNKAQQAGQHQQRIAAAAVRYLAANHATLAAAATATAPARVTVAELQAAGFLSSAIEAANAYGQTPCMLVLQPTPGKLEALLVTEGPGAIPAKDLPFVAAHAGDGNGYIPHGTPITAQGVFGSWQLNAAAMANYLSTSCSATPATGGSLANALFYDSSEAGDFLYRSAVPGHPDLNRMTTPLHMAAVATEGDTGDARCVAADTSTHGRIAVDATGRVLSCQAGEWKRQGSAFWRDGVSAFADLPAADNDVGDVRMVTALGRAFTWTGSGWQALAVDQNGNFSVPGTASAGMVQLNTTVVKNDACPTNGLLARDTAGLVLVCSNGSWRSLLENRVTSTAFYQRYLIRPPDGIQDFTIDLTGLPGPRPLFITGYAYCNSEGNVRAWTVVEAFDGAGNRLGYSGGCGARSENTRGRVMTKGVVPLAKLPENATHVRVYMEPGTLGGDYAQLDLYIKNSE